jgi:hypothetical protein
VLVALLLVLLAQFEDLLQHLYVRALALGLRENLLLGLVQFLEFGLNLFNLLDDVVSEIYFLEVHGAETVRSKDEILAGITQGAHRGRLARRGAALRQGDF